MFRVFSATQPDRQAPLSPSLNINSLLSPQPDTYICKVHSVRHTQPFSLFLFLCVCLNTIYVVTEFNLISPKGAVKDNHDQDYLHCYSIPIELSVSIFKVLPKVI